MYPAQALVDGLYSVADLPDEILLNNVLLDLYDTVFTKTGGSLSFYEATQNGELMSVRIKNYIDMTETERNVWVLLAYGEEFGLSSMPECLITEAQDEDSASKDTFADSYTITLDGGESAVVTRQSICQWTAEIIDEEGTLVTWELVYLSLNDPENPNNYKWLISVQGLTTFGGVKNDPQNSPVGDYFAASIFYVASVS
jgi:hypothetical protein